MRARDFPGGSRGSVVLCFGAADPVLSFKGTPRIPILPPRGSRHSWPLSVTYGVATWLCLATMLEVAQV